eukprot:CAMPEP_0178430752 /NCGR_PEP_ID=MMETSP0689_2-20121128/31483_1 /TAXON_ID=160604 /ORGANISM="Amphidinium massartii, Strain CS-259" /LENGTH=143 /DNA_ID=CAMNT_0020052621 /DNA_START=74 /DNA_END=505 /DNA_ORIENTATION=+
MTEAARKRRAVLARLQQGPDGRWESNKRKAMVRAVKRQSVDLRTMIAKKPTAVQSLVQKRRKKSHDEGKQRSDKDSKVKKKNAGKAAKSGKSADTGPAKTKKAVDVVLVPEEPDLQIVAVSRLASKPWKQKRLTAWMPSTGGA